MTKDKGVPPSGSGCQPTASAAGASSQSGIPNAEESGPATCGDNWFGQVVATWETWRCGGYLLTKSNFYGPWTLIFRGRALWSGAMLQGGMEFARKHHAQAIEARQGGDGTAPSQDESAVPEGDAPGDGQ